MTAIAARRRNRTIAALVSGLVVIATMPVFGVAAWRAIRDSEAAQNVGVIETLAIPSTPAALLAGVDEAGEVASLTVFALHPDGGGGTIVSVPVGIKSDTSIDAVRRVADAYTIDGDEALIQDMQSLMGVTFTVTAVMTQDQIAELFSGLGNSPVSMPVDLRDSDATAEPVAVTTTTTSTTTTTTTVATDPFATTTTTTSAPSEPTDPTTTGGDPNADVVIPGGASEISPADVAAALTARELRAPESDRLPAIRALWDGVAAGIGTGIGSPTVGAGDPTSIEDYVTELISGSVSIWQIGVTPIAAGDDNPEGLDLYKVRRGEIVLVMASVAPSAVSPTLSGASVQIDSAFGDASVTLSAIELFAFFNTNVLLIREIEGPPPALSVVRTADVSAEDSDFSFLEEIIGPFELERVDSRVEGIDLQVTLGESYRTFLADIDFDPTVTTLPEDETTDTTDAAGATTTDTVTTDTTGS